jgi:hypothetical protein
VTAASWLLRSLPSSSLLLLLLLLTAWHLKVPARMLLLLLPQVRPTTGLCDGLLV